MDLRSWFPVVNGVPGFRIPQAKIPRIPECRFPFMGRIFSQKQISLLLNFIVNVQMVYAKIVERRHTINLKKKLFLSTQTGIFLTMRNFLISEMKKLLIVTKWSRQRQQQCIYLKKYKVYNTLCPVNSYNANLGRTRLLIKTLLNKHKKNEKKRNSITCRKKHLTYKFKYRGFCYFKKTKITTSVK